MFDLKYGSLPKNELPIQYNLIENQWYFILKIVKYDV